MFIGHFAAGLATAKYSNAPSLALMFIAVQFLDLLWPILVLLGIETFEISEGITAITPLDFTYYPYSHSLAMTLVWSLLFGGGYFLFTKNRNGALILGLLVSSHWVLDFITHRPDLPLYPGSDVKLGLGLWNAPWIETIIEVAFLLIGSVLFLKSGKVKRRTLYWSLIAFLLVIHLMNVLGPPPPSITAVAWSANLMWIIIFWAWWVEKEKATT